MGEWEDGRVEGEKEREGERMNTPSVPEIFVPN